MMISRQALALVCGTWMALATAQAADAPVERRINDRQIIDLLADIHNRGAAMFNRGDTVGSYRLFEGSLRTIQPLLPADLQSDVTKGLASAERQTDSMTKALALHELIESVRKKLHPTAGPKGTKLPAPKPLTFDEPELAPKLGANPPANKPSDPPARPVSNPSFNVPPPDPVPLPLESLPAPREAPKNLPDVPLKPMIDAPKIEFPKDEGPKIEFPPIDPPRNESSKKDPPTKTDTSKTEPPKKPMPDVPPKPATTNPKDAGPSIFPLPK